MNRHRLGLSILALVIFLAPSGLATPAKSATPGRRAAATKSQKAGPLLGRNLIANGGAETLDGAGAAGWEPKGTLPSASYGHTRGEWGRGVTAAPYAGRRYFRLSVPKGRETIEFDQWVSVAAESMAIDSGRVEVTLSGWFGGLLDGPGTAQISAEFVDGRGAVQGAAESPEPEHLPKPAAGSASIVQQKVSSALPAGTRRIRVTLTGTNRKFADCADCKALGLADNLSLVLSRVDAKP